MVFEKCVFTLKGIVIKRERHSRMKIYLLTPQMTVMVTSRPLGSRDPGVHLDVPCVWQGPKTLEPPAAAVSSTLSGELAQKSAGS